MAWVYLERRAADQNGSDFQESLCVPLHIEDKVFFLTAYYAGKVNPKESTLREIKSIH